MKSETQICKKFLLYFLILIWTCGLGVVHSHNDSDEYSNEVESELGSTSIRNGKLGERQNDLLSALHEQLEHLKPDSENQVDEHIDRDKPHQREDNEEEQNEQEEQEEEEEQNSEEEHNYDPWQDSFQDIYDDGTYVYGYSLPNGVTRYERSFFSEKYKGRVVEGFHTEPRYFGKGILYELRCYRADYYSGYRPLKVQYLKRPPIVRRDTRPNVDCFDKQ